MKKIVFLVLLLGFTQSAFSWSRYDPYPTTTDQETQLKLKLEEMQRKLQQAEIDRESEKEERENAAKEAAEQAKQEAEERAKEASEAAEAAAADLRDQMLRSEIKTRNNLYLSGLLLLIGGGIVYVINKNMSETIMNANQKYGIAIIILSILLLILALVISDGWTNRFDFLENLMLFLKVELISIETECTSTGSDLLDKLRESFKTPCYRYLIDIPTKYVVLAFMSTAAYGLTTYLSITPAFMPWKKSSIK